MSTNCKGAYNSIYLSCKKSTAADCYVKEQSKNERQGLHRRRQAISRRAGVRGLSIEPSSRHRSGSLSRVDEDCSGAANQQRDMSNEADRWTTRTRMSQRRAERPSSVALTAARNRWPVPSHRVALCRISSHQRIRSELVGHRFGLLEDFKS